MSRKEHDVMREMKRRWAIRCSAGELFCFLCGQKIESMKDCNADHWVPKALGGKSTEENLKPAHKRCNSLKGCMSPAEFIEHREEVLSKKYKKIEKDERRYYKKEKKKEPIISRKQRKQQKKQERLLYKTTYKFQQPYEFGTTVFYVKELPGDNKPRFEVKQGVVIGFTVRNGIQYVLVKDFYIGREGKIKSELLDVIPLTKTQAIATKVEYEKLIKQLLAKKNQLSH